MLKKFWRRHRESGSAPLEAIFSIVFLLVLFLGLTQVAFALYGRNVVMSSAHEGARAAVELGRDASHAATVAKATVQHATGSLVKDLAVQVAVHNAPHGSSVRVEVSGLVNALGPVPVPIPVTATSTVTRETPPR